jgi:hypothetical protein
MLYISPVINRKPDRGSRLNAGPENGAEAFRGHPEAPVLFERARELLGTDRLEEKPSPAKTPGKMGLRAKRLRKCAEMRGKK